MTKEQLKDEIIVAMSNVLDVMQLTTLKDVLTSKFAHVEVSSNTELATLNNNNDYYLDMFKAFKSQRLSEKTINMYMYSLKRFLEVVNKPLVNVSQNDIEYFLMIQGKTNNEVSLNNMRRNLSAFFSWLVKKRVITFNPCDGIEPYKEIKKPIEHLEPEDMELVKDGCSSSRDRAIVEFMRCTAVRVGEAVNMKISDIDFKTGKVIVYGEKTKTYRVVMLDNVAMGYIKKYLYERGETETSNAPLFASIRKGESLTDSGIREVLKGIAKRGGMDRRLYPHLFRKSCATSIIRRGGTVGDAGDYLGHSDNSVTGRHYAFKDDSHVVNIFNKYVACV